MIVQLIMFGVFSLGVFFLILSYIVVRHVNQRKKTLHLPSGKITYTDLHTLAQPLFSSTYRLTGKPDFILKQKDAWIPVEYKSGRYETPPIYHILQVAAYCQLIEDTEHSVVPYGWVVYPTGRFQVAFSAQLRFQLQKVLDEIRCAKKSGWVELNHYSPRKCRRCSFRVVCPYRLS